MKKRKNVDLLVCSGYNLQDIAHHIFVQNDREKVFLYCRDKGGIIKSIKSKSEKVKHNEECEVLFRCVLELLIPIQE